MLRSGLALAVLALLYEAPMHPYRMQRLIKERGKDAVVNVGQRSQLYKTIDRLQREGMIAVAEVEREAARPERTVYTITEAGRRATVEWTTAMLATPRRDFPEFTAGLAYLPVLTTEQVITALSTRLDALTNELTELDRRVNAVIDELPRLVLIEEEYMRAHLRTDIEWVEALLDDLRESRLTWNPDQMREYAEQFESTEHE
jgi:DNA-binding PadR family transcriptional regulator